MSKIEHKHYKELQKEAKRLNIPANMKRSFLEPAIEAKKEKNEEKLKSILDYNRNMRKRRLNNKLKSLNKVKSKKKYPNRESIVKFDKDHIRVDSQELSFYPDSTSMSQTSSFGSTLNQYSSMSSVSNFSREYSPIEIRNSYGSGYFKSVPTVISRNMLNDAFPKNDSNTLLYNHNVYRTPILQSSQYYDNANYNFSQESYCSQIPANTRNYQCSNWTPYSEIKYERQLMMYPMKNEFYSKSNQHSSNESDYLLPNIPQLRGSPETSPSWSQTSTIDRYPGAENQNESRNIDNGSINVEFDSNSDTETLSLPEEIVNFFESDPENRHKIENGLSCVSSSAQTTPQELLPISGQSVFNPSYPANKTINGMAVELNQISSQLPLQTNDRRDHLPSISTLIPYPYSTPIGGHEFSAYQEYVKSKVPCDVSSFYGQMANQNVEPLNYSNENGENLTSYKMDKHDGNGYRNYTIPYLSCSSNQNSASILKSYLSNKMQPMSELPESEESSISSSAIEDISVPAGILNLFPSDMLNEAFDEIKLFEDKSDCAKSRVISKNYHSDGETELKQEATRLIYKREMIAIKDIKMDTETKKDLICKSFQVVKHKEMKKKEKNEALQVYANDPLISLYRPCKYYDRGCIVVLKNNEAYAKLHEKECGHQFVYCPMEKCSWNQSMKTLSSHIYEHHKTEMNIGNDLVYVINRIKNDDPAFITYLQLFEGTIFVIRLHLNDSNCVATMQYIPEIENTTCRKKQIKGIMQLIYFTNRVESTCWKGLIQPYFENDEILYQKGDTLQSSISTSKNIVLRVLTG